MENIKQFMISLRDKISNAIEEGNVFKANEITSNMMTGAIISMMIIVSSICLVFNEIGIFTADKLTMRCTMLTSLIVETPIMVLNSKYHGEGKWIRPMLMWGLILICSFLSAALGHNVTLVMVIPVLLSIRYCDVNFTRRVALESILFFGAACVFNAWFGIVNLNAYPVSADVMITAGGRLRECIDFSSMDHWAYFRSLMINDYLPRLMAYSVIGFSAIRISQRGKDMTKLQEEVTKKTARLETELNLATEIQAGMLPKIFPAFPEHGELDLYAYNHPAKEVGGDFYDYFPVDDDHIAIVMADVSGKGVGAALFMTIAKITLKNQLLSYCDPAIAMTLANKLLCENNDAELFVTTWCGIYEISSKTLTYSNAGHNLPLLMRKEKAPVFLEGKKGFVLAGLEMSRYVNNSIELNAGDEIFLYTDGVTEANDKDEKLFGDKRLMEEMSKLQDRDVRGQIDAMMKVLNTYMAGTDQFDDITMMGMKITD